MNRTARIALVVGGVVVIVVALVIVLAVGGGDGAPKTANAHVAVVNGKPAGGVKTIKAAKGGTINLDISSDVADEVHVHGYDLLKDVPAGGSVTFRIPAKLDGVFEVELERRGVDLAKLEVEP